jgi:FkbM family methyltransferase
MTRALTALLKPPRDAVADTLAWAILRVPALERWFRGVGPGVSQRPLASVFYRRVRSTVTAGLARSDRRYQTVKVGPVRMRMDVTDFTCNGLYFGGTQYEPATAACLVEHLRPGATFVDIGANHGYFTVMAGLLVGASGRVFAFEPNPDVMAQLTKHVSLNALTNVRIEPLAVADADQDAIDLYVSACDSNSGLSSLSRDAPAFAHGGLRADRRVRVRAIALDTWARNLAGRIDLMKIDVEGAEHRVVAGMRRLLAERPPLRIVCETTRDSEAHRLLLSHGYEPRDLDVTPGYRNLLYTHRSCVGTGGQAPAAGARGERSETSSASERASTLGQAQGRPERSRGTTGSARPELVEGQGWGPASTNKSSEAGSRRT